MPSPVERLPVEVFDIIACDLDLSAYNALRLVSRQLHLLSFSTYAKRYLSEVTTTLGSASLDRLVNVANHQHLSKTVIVLDVRLLNHCDYKLLTKISRVGIFPPPKRFPRVPGVRPHNISEEATLYDDVVRSEYPKCIVERLTRALRGFGNLQTIRFRAHHSEPFGWRSTMMPAGDLLFRSKCFRAVMDAVVRSGVNLKEFGMAKGRRLATLSKCANLPYPTLELPLPFHQQLQHRFSALESLTLSVITAYNGDARIPGWENGLSNLIASAPLIKTLALSLDCDHRISHYSAVVIRSLSLSCRAARLSTFQLVNCSLHEADLATFIAAHSDSLRQLVFSDIRLLTGSWSSLWTSLKDVGSIQCLRVASLEGTRSPVLFRRRNKERLSFTLESEKMGRPMSSMLDDLVVACIMGTDTDAHVDGLDGD